MRMMSFRSAVSSTVLMMILQLWPVGSLQSQILSPQGESPAVLEARGSAPSPGSGTGGVDVGENRRQEKAETQASYIDPGLKTIVQVAIVVRDIEATSKRWGELLGMPVPEIRTTRPGQEVKVIYRGMPSDGQVKLTFFHLGQVVLELMEPVGDDTSWKEFLDTYGEGVHHLGFQVMDPGKTSAALEEAGYPMVHRGRYDSDDGTYIYHDTLKALGVIVELLHSDGRK